MIDIVINKQLISAHQQGEIEAIFQKWNCRSLEFDELRHQTIDELNVTVISDPYSSSVSVVLMLYLDTGQMEQIKARYKDGSEKKIYYRYFSMDELFDLKRNEGNIVVKSNWLTLALSDVFSFITDGIFCVDLYDYLYFTNNVVLYYHYFRFEELNHPETIRAIEALNYESAVHLFICKYDCDNIETMADLKMIREKYDPVYDLLKGFDDCQLEANERGLVIYSQIRKNG